jgi:phosphoribosylglycinamide formyltransferase-1
MSPSPKRIAIFASGTGTNAENIIKYFQQRNTGEVVLVACNKKEAPVLGKAKALGVDVLVIDKELWTDADAMLAALEIYAVDVIVLAGFLWLVPEYLVKAYPNRIINIHPALLPKYGGKGMYGDKVHASVLENREEETGITIHYVNDKYDEGEIIFQAKCGVDCANDSAETIAKKVHALEYEHFPRVIEEVLAKL